MEETNSEKENHKTEIRFGICQILDASRLNYVVKSKAKITEDEKHLLTLGLHMADLEKIKELITQAFKYLGSYETKQILTEIMSEYKGIIKPELDYQILKNVRDIAHIVRAQNAINN